jgi:hypothetical protein
VPHSTAPAWLTIIAWTWLSLSFASAAVMALDIFVLGNRQKMAVMNLVYPITALYFGPLAVWFYRSWRRDEAWAVKTKAVMHCGAGCTLGDIGAEWLVFTLGLIIAGKAIYADIPLDFAFGLDARHRLPVLHNHTDAGPLGAPRRA